MKNIAIILSTFLRDDLLFETVQSIPKNKYCILIGDQGKPSEQKSTYFKMRRYKDVIYLTLPFDIGLSATRNFLVKKAQELECKHCIITADSIQFTKSYDFQPIIDFLEEDPRRGSVGFSLKDRIPWETDLELIEGNHFLLKAPTSEKINYKGIDFQRVDMHRNFFLAKTGALLHTPWDEDLKLCEHIDNSWRWKNNYKYFPEFGMDIYQPYQRFYTDVIEAKYVDNKPIEYKKFRNRMYSEFRKKFQEKYKISGWVAYDEKLKQIFNEFKRRK